MQCKRCLNTDTEFFYKGSRGWYCRKCIGFGRVMLEEEMEPVSLQKPKEGCEEYFLQFPLTISQQTISHKCAQSVMKNDVLLDCVCGAGKTELVAESISQTLRNGGKVCFAIPRRQVVLELAERLRQYFPSAHICAVCGGHTEVTDGDLIVCTTHQLFRYYKAFSLLVLDEPDAFPFKGSDVLHGIAQTAVRGHVIYLTATPDVLLNRRVNEGSLVRLCLNNRPHGHPLPIPIVKVGPVWMNMYFLLRWIRAHRDHPRMVFVPTVKSARILAMVLDRFERCYCCTSHTEERDEVIERYRNEPHGLMVCTTVLERGVTIPGVDICVWNADHSVFDEASLVQMAGRAGRSFSYPDGNVLFLCQKRSTLVQACRRSLEEKNHALSDVS